MARRNNMTNTETNTPVTDILFGTLAVLFAKGLCLGRHYSVGTTHTADGETRLAVLDLQGTPVAEAASADDIFEVAHRFAALEAHLPLGVGDNTVPQYSPEHPNFPARS
jgi:hypothetical protein